MKKSPDGQVPRSCTYGQVPRSCTYGRGPRPCAYCTYGQGRTFLGVLLADQRVRGIGKANIAAVVTLTSSDLKEVQKYTGKKRYNEKVLIFVQNFISRIQEVPGTKQKSLYNYFPYSIGFAKTIEIILKIDQARDDSAKLVEICEGAPLELHWARRKQKVPEYVQAAIKRIGFLSKKIAA